MKEWFLENTNVSKEEYDSIMIYRESINEKNRLIEKIDLYNLESFSLEKPNFFNRFKYQIRKRGKDYIYKDIVFRLFYDYFKDEKLFSVKRYRRCHEYSFLYATLYPIFDIETAICRDRKNILFLHSYLVLTTNSFEKVYDYTLNLVMAKEDYYKLLDVKLVSRINKKDFKEYQEYLKEHQDIYQENLDISEVLCFPKEIKEGIKKLTRKKE